MKWLLTGDWHIGVRGDSDLYHNIIWTWVDDFLVPTIKKERVEVLSILGDIFDNRNTINVKSENVAIEIIKFIKTECPDLIIHMLVGNHDCYFKNTREINSLRKFKDLRDVLVIDNLLLFPVDSKRIITYCPWIVSEEEAECVMKTKGDFLLGHFPFNGYEKIHGVKETRGYSLDVFKKNYLKVFTGHFHLRNDVYVGNPFQMDWNDTEDQKGILIFDTNTLSEKFIPNTISPIYKKVYLSQLKNKTVDLDIFKGNFIKLFLDTPYTEKIVEKLQEVIISKEPLSFTIEGLTDADINTDVPVNDLVNPMESLINWLGKIEMKKGVDRDRLIEKVSLLYNNSLQ